MKAFIEKVFKMKKQKQKELLDEISHSEAIEESTEVIEENKKILSKQIEISIKEHVEEVKQHTDTKDD